MDGREHEQVDSLASICLTCGRANLTFPLYNALCLFSNGFPSKYTVFKCSLSLSSLSSSDQSLTSQLLAHSSSSSFRGPRPDKEVTGLELMSIVFRDLTEESGSIEVSALCDI